MARLYETKDEQANRELRDYYAGRTPAPASIPPPRRVSQPRYQTLEQMSRKAIDAQRRIFLRVRAATGRSPIGP